MAAIKNEIGVPTDVAKLLDRLEANQQRMENAVKAVLAEFTATRPNSSFKPKPLHGSA